MSSSPILPMRARLRMYRFASPWISVCRFSRMTADWRGPSRTSGEQSTTIVSGGSGSDCGFTFS